jgi:hypothetical protein
VSLYSRVTKGTIGIQLQHVYVSNSIQNITSIRLHLVARPAEVPLFVWRRPDSSAGEAPRWGVSVADEVGGSSMNKCAAAPISGGLLLLFLLLAGQGGEGQRKRNRGAWGSDDRRGICSISASRRDAGRCPLLCLGKLPRWKPLEHLELESPIPIERCRPPDNSCAPPLTFSAGLRGEGEGVGGHGHVLLRGWINGPAAGAVLMVFRCIGLLASLPLPASFEDQQFHRDTATSDANLVDLCRCPSSAAPRKESGSYTADLLRIAIQVVFAFWPLGCIRRRQLRSSLMLLPRFSGEDLLVLSSVMLTPYLQLNLQPRWSLPSRLLVEPLALRMERLLEAPEVHSCRFISSVFSTDPLAGSDCVLPRRRLGFLAVFITSVGSGSSLTFNHLSSLCKSLCVLS